MLQKWEDGTVKMYLILKALNYRRENQDLFSEGDFIPLGGMGKWSDHFCAFARKAGDKAALIIVPRFLTRLLSSPFEKPFGRQVWGDTRVVLPEETGGARFANLFTGEILQAVPEGDQSILMLGEVFAHFPVALLEKIS
jgi:(1->4)-alpha-D-glucan 1-alpha-D-glucosylmutase